jgi:putative endonuclease
LGSGIITRNNRQAALRLKKAEDPEKHKMAGERAEWLNAAVLPRDFAGAKNVVAFDPLADHHAKNRKSMSYFVYVLRSTVAERLYIGSSAEPELRLRSHNFGRVRSTRAWRPWERVLLEQYPDRATAEKRESAT